MNLVILLQALVFYLCIQKYLAAMKVEEFTQFNSPCQVKQSIVLTTKATSLLHCALFCETNGNGSCYRYMWIHDTMVCMLQSHNVNPGTNPELVIPQVEWLVFNRKKTGCTKAGYDYHPETKTCLQYKETSPVTWHEAKTLCNEDGGDLISLTSKEKMDFVFNYLYCRASMWIGLKGFRWVSGENFTDYGYTYDFNSYDGAYINDPEMDCCKFSPKSSDVFQDESCNIRTKPRMICEILIS